ncbi:MULTISPECIES: PilZ domain-containing protein [Pseudovibrio]|uniref:PilZ domain-containing protein n=1 Tax=Stappiaceae TaxID=2821832 RepID=UPI002366B0CC|nr:MULTISPECIES: PilZ domain-containing protein [Pseudovibrio]MDD7910990.1 PilZ domain-containing protein [Pseudovibrio exalbescens]MDX5593287.1 PilZ domain-containing protein [Pseudovibrio sp. SPO723]
MLPKPKLIEMENRAHPRRACRWRAVLLVEPFNRACVVEDIGEGGCRISVNPRDLTIGSHVVINVVSKGTRFEGIIRWIQGDEVGIAFEGAHAGVAPALVSTGHQP